MQALIVIGASAGGMDVLSAIFAGLPASLPAPVLVVTHLGARKSLLPEILGKTSALPVRFAEEREPVRPGRILLAPPADCAPACVTLSQQLDKVWQLFGHNADNVEILWLGTPPAQVAAMPALKVLQAQPAFRAKLPGVDDPAGTPVYVIDPNGFVVFRYAPGFEPGGLRADLSKLLKLM